MLVKGEPGEERREAGRAAARQAMDAAVFRVAGGCKITLQSWTGTMLL